MYMCHTYMVTVWLSGNALINIVALCWVRLVLGLVTIQGYTILIFNQSTQAYSAWPSLWWVGAMSTGNGLCHR